MFARMKQLLLALPMLLCAAPAYAAVDSGDTAWMLTSTALVLFMTPGLAFFYAGMVRGKNAVSTLYQSMIALGVVGVLWVVIGFSLAFSGNEHGGFIGDMAKAMFAGVGQEPDGTSTIPYLLFALFQMMFAIITPALITGAFAERVAFKAWVLFLALWSLVVYAPVCHWVWTPEGMLAKKGALDFAGGFVVHMTAGYSALVAAILFGKRRDTGKAYDTGLIALGTAMLWFGWFGFNAGSALTSGGLATQAFGNTFIAAAVAMLAWALVDMKKDGKPTLVGACIGVVAGLVAITPGAGYVTIQSAMIIGLLAGVLCNIGARMIKGRFNIDDTLDVFACHGIGGTIGIIAVGFMADKAVNSAGGMGYLTDGTTTLLTAQATGAVMVAVYSMVATFILFKIVGAITPLRVADAAEQQGLDASEHGEKINNG